MNVQEYNAAVTPINKKIEELTSAMVSKVHQLISENDEALVSLILDDEFQFYSVDGKLLSKKTENLAVELFNYGGEKIYYDSTQNNLVYFESTDFDVDLANELPDSLLEQIFQDKEHFNQAVHVIGLSGILESNLAHKKALLEHLQD